MRRSTTTPPRPRPSASTTAPPAPPATTSGHGAMPGARIANSSHPAATNGANQAYDACNGRGTHAGRTNQRIAAHRQKQPSPPTLGSQPDTHPKATQAVGAARMQAVPNSGSQCIAKSNRHPPPCGHKTTSDQAVRRGMQPSRTKQRAATHHTRRRHPPPCGHETDAARPIYGKKHTRRHAGRPYQTTGLRA